MRIRIDLKIIIFMVLFILTHQIKIYLIIMFFSIIHEMGHIIMGIIMKMKVDKVELMPFGLSVSFKKDLNYINSENDVLEIKKICVAVAGPLVSFLLIVLYTYIKPLYISQLDAIYSNFLILIFNLIPLYPLDGGRIVKGILNIKFGERKSRILINRISNITMICITIMSSIAVYYFKNIAIFLVCIFLWIITLQENKLNIENYFST